MKLRVVGLATILLVIVSSSFIARVRKHIPAPPPVTDTDLLDGATTFIPSVSGDRDPESPGELIDLGVGEDFEDDSVDRSNSRLNTRAPVESAMDEVATTERSLPTSQPAAPQLSESNGDRSPQVAVAQEVGKVQPWVAVPSEPMALPDVGQEPLATTWDREAAKSADDRSGAAETPAPSDQLSETNQTSSSDATVAPVAPAQASLAATDSGNKPAATSTSILAPAKADVVRELPPSVSQNARSHLEYGGSLARRGSLFSAREEFFAGLRVIIESLDLINGTSAHRDHYGLAIRAMNEAEDFACSAGDEASMPVATIVELHQSRILTPDEIATFSPLASMQTYFAFAQSHLSAACGQSPLASEILCALGKLHSVKSSQNPSGQSADLAIAILMHEAALKVDPGNYRSANELGVALAKLGQYAPARAALLKSIAANPSPEAWLNLSIVHRALGETRLAELALGEHHAAEAARHLDSPIAQRIRWTTSDEFGAVQQADFSDGASRDGSAVTTASVELHQPPAQASIWTKMKASWGGK